MSEVSLASKIPVSLCWKIWDFRCSLETFMRWALDVFQSRKRQSQQAGFFWWRRAVMIFRRDGADSVLTYMLQDLLWLVKGLGSPVHESWTWLNEWIVQRMNWCLVALCNSCSYGWPNALSPSWLLLILLEKRKSFQCQMPNLRGETDCQCVETSVPGTWKPFFFPPSFFFQTVGCFPVFFPSTLSWFCLLKDSGKVVVSLCKPYLLIAIRCV